MEQNQPIRWNFTLEYIPETAKWRVSFNACVWPPIFNKEEQEFTTIDACVAWLKTKQVEFDEGIDIYLKKLRMRTYDSIRSNGKDQSAYFDRSLLIEILEAIPEEQVCLTIQENYPLLITPTCQREYSIALVTMNYNLETEEEEEKDDDEDD
jgi:hypothetical protein